MGSERQITSAGYNHMLTHTGVWSADGEWIVYDIRSDAQGSVFDGLRIERIHTRTGEIQVLYESKNGAYCGVATCNPVADQVVFIEGPEHPTVEWSYAASRRQGLIVKGSVPGIADPLEARDLTPPFTSGALRGGTHVHVFSGDGQWVSFTYEDQILEQFTQPDVNRDFNQRNVGVSVPRGPVCVPKSHARNRDGEYFSVLVTRTVSNPVPGSDEISKAFEDSWVGRNGYAKPDGTRQKRAIAFQGQVVTASGEAISEVFIVDIPEDVMNAGDGPLQGTATRRPFPPKGTEQRRLTFTADRKYPGLQGPRHWLRSSPDGSRIAFLMKDDSGVVQLWTVPPNGGSATQLTRNVWSIASAFSWSPDGKFIAHGMDNSIVATDASNGLSMRLTPRSTDAQSPRPEACVYSPDGSQIAYLRTMAAGGTRFNQVFTVPAGATRFYLGTMNGFE